MILMLGIVAEQIVYATEECGFSIPSGGTCSIISPFISPTSSACSSVTLNVSSSTDGSLHTTDGLMSEIGSTGTYNYSITFPDHDTYVVKLCDNTVRTITVINISAPSDSVSWWSFSVKIILNDTSVIQDNQVVINTNVLNVSNQVWEENASKHFTAGTFGNYINSIYNCLFLGTDCFQEWVSQIDIINTTVFWIERLQQ